MDSFAGNTEVPDSQAVDVEAAAKKEAVDVQAMEAAHSIMHGQETKVSVFEHAIMHVQAKTLLL
jgi:hypothetical protein